MEIQSQFLRGNEQVYQCQVAFVLPGERVMMAFTYARTTPLTPADMTRWAEIKKESALQDAAGSQDELIIQGTGHGRGILGGKTG